MLSVGIIIRSWATLVNCTVTDLSCITAQAYREFEDLLRDHGIFPRPNTPRRRDANVVITYTARFLLQSAPIINP